MNMNRLHNTSGKKVAFGGLVTALSTLCLYLASVLPTNRLFFYAISSMFVFTMVIEFGIPSAIITYLSITILALILLPNKIMIIPYLLFFGYYGILKYYIEKRNNLLLEWLLKIISFNIAMVIIYFIVEKLILKTITMRYYLWVTILLGEVAFVVYDLGYTVVISYYKHRLRNRLK